MKTFTTLLLTAFALLTCNCTPDHDSVKQAQEQNKNSAIDKDISRFMTEAADARMMDIEEGKLAQEKGTTAEVKQYGQLMIEDQTKMLKELRVLASSKNIMLPNTLSIEKAKGLEDLKQETGADFDLKFIKMMKLDHKRDVDEFDDATDFEDRDIKKFATKYLPVVESHLDKIKQLEDKQ
jgi:putative membrane protein